MIKPAQFNAQLISKEEAADDIYLFRFTKPEGFYFKAGQFVVLALPDFAADEPGGNRRYFSIASPPHFDNIEIAMKRGASPFKSRLEELRPGESAEITGPYGKFVLSEKTDEPAAFLAGGIGITPFRSMTLDALYQKQARRIFLFYSNYRPEDAAFLDDFMSLAAGHNNFVCIPTMTHMTRSKKFWSGEQEMINRQMLKKYLAGTQPLSYFIAGSPGFVSAIREMVLSCGTNQDDIHLERFVGYNN